MKGTKLAAGATGAYSVSVLLAGLVGYAWKGSVVSLVLSMIAAGLLAMASVWLARGRLTGGFLAGVTALVLGLFFGYGFISSGEFFPGGAMLLVSFAALFFVLIGMFLSLER